MVQISPINFGLIIAYFLPGIVSFYALSYVSEGASNLFQAALGNPINIGAIFFLVVASIVTGLIVSSLRVILLETLHYRLDWSGRIRGHKVFFEIPRVHKPNTDYNKLKDEKLALFKEVVENVYRYYQFYGNIMISLVFLWILRYPIAKIPTIETRKHFTLFAVNIVAIVFLFISSRKSLKDVCKTVSDICQ